MVDNHLFTSEIDKNERVILPGTVGTADGPGAGLTTHIVIKTR